VTLREKLRRFYRGMLSRFDIQNIFCDMKLGERHGPCEEYYHGHLWGTCVYEYGRVIGLRKIYHENGQVCTVSVYNLDGEKDGEELTYYEDGQLKRRCLYKDGTYFGLCEDYYENGQLEQKVTHDENGNRDDMGVQYHKNGQLAQKCFYKDGRLDGPMEIYDEKGHLIEREVYQHDLKLEGESAEDYLVKWKSEHKKTDWEIQLETEINQKRGNQRQQTIEGLKEQLERATDREEISKIVGPARTPERKVYAERIVRTRRARDVLATAAQKAAAKGEEETLREIIEIAKPYAARYRVMLDKTRRKRLQRRRQSGKE